MTRNGFPRLDYSMLSSYLGRWTTLIIFTVTILIAAGALFLEEDDIAHMPVTIGVYDLDSAVVHLRLIDLTDYIREKGGGDVQWRYLDDHEKPSGCDFYMMTALRLAPLLERDDLECSLLITVQEGRRYSRGCVIVRRGFRELEGEEMTAVFKSPYSVSGFLSPFNSLKSALNGSWGEGELVEFAGSEERIIYGIIFGAYTFGGISVERLSMLEEMGVFAGDEIEVFLEGEAYPEMVLAVDKSMEERKHRRFRDRFVLLTDRMPPGLKADLMFLGISGFVTPRSEDIDTILGLLEKSPTGFGYPMKSTGRSR
jgi:hypothetical protein